MLEKKAWVKKKNKDRKRLKKKTRRLERKKENSERKERKERKYFVNISPRMSIASRLESANFSLSNFETPSCNFGQIKCNKETVIKKILSIDSGEKALRKVNKWRKKKKDYKKRRKKEIRALKTEEKRRREEKKEQKKKMRYENLP